MRADIFLSLPAPTALLILSLLDLTQAEVPAQPTKTLEYRVLNVIPYHAPRTTPPPPTNIFQFRALRHRRQSNSTNTVCGYIGGDPSLPATCSVGSHCVQDTENKVMGCCPDGAAQCTTGVFTGCVDFRSGPQTLVNPYVYTCGNGDMCYQNAFENGYSQYGCGSKTDMGTTVAAAAATSSGSEPRPSSGSELRLDIPTLAISKTASATTVSAPITISNVRSLTFSSSSSSTSVSSSTSTSSSSSSSSTTSPAVTTPAPAPAPSTTPASTSSTTNPSAGTGSSTDGSITENQTSKPDQTGVIVGSTISGVAGLVAIVAVAIFLLQRRNRNKRTDVNGDSTYISPMSHGPDFKPIDGDRHVYGGDTVYNQGGYVYPGQHPALYGNGGPGAYGPPTMSGAAGGPSAFPAAAVAGGVAAGAGGAAAAHYAYGYTDEPYDGTLGAPHHGSTEHLPLHAGVYANQGELDDFSTGFQRALSRIGEETDDESRPDVTLAQRPDVDMRNMAHNGTEVSPQDFVSPLDDNEARPIWQRQSRQGSNTMWL